MIDIIAYSTNPAALVTEIQTKKPKLVDANGKLVLDKTPTMKKGGKTIALIRCRKQSEVDWLDGLTNLEVIGTYEEMLANSAWKAKYDSIWDRTPVNGQVPPAKFGVFADASEEG